MFTRCGQGMGNKLARSCEWCDRNTKMCGKRCNRYVVSIFGCRLIIVYCQGLPHGYVTLPLGPLLMSLTVVQKY